MEFFDQSFVPNGSDNSARYSYENQPFVCKWNLQKLAIALHPLLSIEKSNEILNSFDRVFEEKKFFEMKKKFGFVDNSNIVNYVKNNDENNDNDEEQKDLIAEYFLVLNDTKTDFTDSFVALTESIEDFLTFFFNLNKNNNTINNNNNVEKNLIGQELEQIEKKMIKKIVSRSATPVLFIENLKKKLKIIRLNMHEKDVLNFIEIFEKFKNNQEKLLEIFNDCSVENLKDIQNEVENEKKKLFLRQQIINEIKSLELKNENMKKINDTELWKMWCQKYLKELGLKKNENSFFEDDFFLNKNNNENIIIVLQEARKVMRKSNPTFVLRNWILQHAIDVAENKTKNSIENNDKNIINNNNAKNEEKFKNIQVLLKIIKNPFDPSLSTFLINENNKNDNSNNSNYKNFDSQVEDSKEKFNEEEMVIVKQYTTAEKPVGSESLICTCSS
jgi:uncharacterized protein YdiU (UPF0061 family)